MPIVHVNLLQGRSDEQLQRLARAITEAVVDCVEVQPEAVRVLIHEIAPGHWFAAGESIARPLTRD